MLNPRLFQRLWNLSAVSASPLMSATFFGGAAGCCATSGAANATSDNRTSKRFIEIPPKRVRRRGAEQGYGAGAFRWRCTRHLHRQWKTCKTSNSTKSGVARERSLGDRIEN